VVELVEQQIVLGGAAVIRGQLRSRSPWVKRVGIRKEMRLSAEVRQLSSSAHFCAVHTIAVG
jgi:hypothetical protein